MAYTPTGVQSLFPVLLPRQSERREASAQDYETQIAQNENNLNQNFSILFDKLLEMEDQLRQVT